MQRPGRACSSYLVQTPSAAVLFDAGSGAVGSLQRAIDYPAIDAIVVSHMHADHFLDLVPLRYGLTYGPLRRAEPMPVWLPPSGMRRLAPIAAAFSGEGGDFFGNVFAVGEYEPLAALKIGDLSVAFAPARHYVEAYAVRVECGGAAFVYSGDTAPCDAVVEHARDASLFICEATLALGTEPEPRGHCSAREAGVMARRANARALALTHYYADADQAALVEAARAEFTGDVVAADDGMEFALA